MLLEWLNVVVRWAHVIAAIMWIGDSFLFMWLDSKLRKPQTPRDGDVVGELHMAHSGGFYELVKFKSLRELPPELHWFKWESYTTWITGVLLLLIVYWAGGRAMLLDTDSALSQHAAWAISLGTLVGSLAVYHVLCKTPLIRSAKAFGVVGLGLVLATGWGLAEVFTPRATFLHVGAMLGTVMASNVFLIIIPAQRHMLAATAAGTPVDTSYGMRAKQRSTHNHYLTLPVLFTMLSNHFPGLYGHGHAWAVLGLVCVAGVGAKYVMNTRGQTPAWILAGTAITLGASVYLTAPVTGAGASGELAAGPRVSFATAEAIVQARCVSCHADTPANPAFAAAPDGVRLETPAQLHAYADRMMARAVQTHTMPLGNLTGMTDEERRLLGAWIAQGADLDAPGPSALTPAPPPAPAPPPDPGSAAADPAAAARQTYATRCALCHGESGRGDGAAGVSLTPPPRDFSDAAWQAATPDDLVRKAVLEGGAAIGKSAAMPPAPDLAERPDELAALIALLRGFKAANEGDVP